MHIIINHASMIPIYEQIMEQIKTQILSGKLPEGTPLPSVRKLSGELSISALTVKKAYDILENEGYTVTVHGKGSYVAAVNLELQKEEQVKKLEKELQQTISKGRQCGLTDEEIRSLFDILMEE